MIMMSRRQEIIHEAEDNWAVLMPDGQTFKSWDGFYIRYEDASRYGFREAYHKERAKQWAAIMLMKEYNEHKNKERGPQEWHPEV